MGPAAAARFHARGGCGALVQPQPQPHPSGLTQLLPDSRCPRMGRGKGTSPGRGCGGLGRRREPASERWLLARREQQQRDGRRRRCCCWARRALGGLEKETDTTPGWPGRDAGAELLDVTLSVGTERLSAGFVRGRESKRRRRRVEPGVAGAHERCFLGTGRGGAGVSSRRAP